MQFNVLYTNFYRLTSFIDKGIKFVMVSLILIIFHLL
jgi:hypothetical protein